MAHYSILDLVPITLGSDAACALERSKQLAIKAESWGYHRYWVAEHHNMPGIASSATAVVIGHLASATQTIRVGSGGIMLPNHAPLVVAEQFGTLATLYPNRIDLGHWPRTWHRWRDHAGPASQSCRQCRGLSPRCDGASALPQTHSARTARERNARRRDRSADLDFGVEPIWRATRRCPRHAVCLCLTFCAQPADGCDSNLSRTIQALRNPQGALRHAWF